MAAEIADEEDLMEFDSDPYLTPDSTWTQPSPSSQSSPSNKQSSISEPVTEEKSQDSKSTLKEPPNLEMPEMEELDIGRESDEEPLLQTSDPAARSMSERKKARKMVFSSWVAQHAETVTKERVREIVENADEPFLSIRNLMSKQESNVIISDPREYQVELFEKAKQQNTIAVLDTGSGKTLIAVLLLRYMLDKELENRQLQGYKPKTSFFLVDCVTLVFQQFAVLECNLDQKIERFCGEMGCELWSKSVWEQLFKDNMVVVCTAEILHQCLMHSFISLDQINLLIFDEAHHAKKNHAYARIMKDFYMQELNLKKRPKIFGMTASPVDAKQDVVEAARQLEVMLDCQIATAADLSLLRMSVSRPKEKAVTYSRLRAAYLTPLCARLKETFGDLESVQRVLAFSMEATSELGEWCADHVWRLGLKEEEARKIERKTERLYLTGREGRLAAALDADLDRIRKAQQFVDQWNFLEAPNPSLPNNISSKVSLLIQYLQLIFKKSSSTRCIVFVKRRYTARILVEMFSRIDIPNVRLGLLIGTRPGDAGDVKISFRQQVLTLRDFKEGSINCLFATSIAEEGLDIPDCNVIVRFDLYATLIQYIQSRGRARHVESQYIHMLEEKNMLHIQALRDVRSGEDVMRQFCEALPADRLLQGNDCNLESVLAKEKSMRRYTEPETGATLTYTSSLVVLAHYVSCLAYLDKPKLPATTSSNGIMLQPNYFMTTENKRYVCEVVLPEQAPIRSAVGRPASNKAIAKRSAAFEMCIQLRKGDHLDGNLISTLRKFVPANANAMLAVNVKKRTEYGAKLKPRLWEDSRGCFPKKLYLTVLKLGDPENLLRPSQPLALVTRTHLPAFPAINLHLPSDKISQALSISVTNCLNVTESMVSTLNNFTRCIWRDIYAKTFEDNIPQMSYWFAPILKDAVIDSHNSVPTSLIDWDVLRFTDLHNFENPIKWTVGMPDTELEDRFMVDPGQGARRFYSAKVNSILRPSDQVPCQDLQGNVSMESILGFSRNYKNNTEEHRSEQIHVQRGMGKNYERLEFIGDCFLKMATTIPIFAIQQDHDEFHYHVARMEMICNKNLLENALKIGLPEYIRDRGITRTGFYPHGIKLLAGKGITPTSAAKKHSLGDKTIADVCEALIGAALLSYQDTKDMDMAVKAVSKMVSNRVHAVNKWSEYWPLYEKPPWQLATATASQLDLAAQIERKHKYHFRYPRLLRSAFMHPSYPFLYEKMAMVSNKFLAALAVELGFHRHLRCAGMVVEDLNRKFVVELEELKQKANGRRDYWTAAENPPKCLADIVESYIGAIFVDSEFDFQQVEHFFETHVRCFFEDMHIYDTFANNHPVTHLHNHLTLIYGCNNYSVMADEVPSVDGLPPRNVAAVIIHDRVIAHGSASSTKNAKVKACLAANDLLRDLSIELYRKDYGCDCEEVRIGQQAKGVGSPPDATTIQSDLLEVGTAI
ncbi:MAG: hypothetical protein Q9195_007060 [Heterodermia aff. obscurata]